MIEKICDEIGVTSEQLIIKQLQQENKKLNGAIQTYDILLKSNVEENKELKRIINESTKMIDECACYNEKDKECKCNFSSMAMTTLRKILKGEITSYHEDKKVSE